MPLLNQGFAERRIVFLADRIGWRGAYLCMAALMLPGILAAVLAPEPHSDKTPHLATSGFFDTIWAPIRELLTRLGPMAPVILLLVAGFRMPSYVTSAMAIPLFKHQGFSNTDIATKLFGFRIALDGTFLAGALIPRIRHAHEPPHRHSGRLASHLSLDYLAAHGGDGGTAFWTFAAAVGVQGWDCPVSVKD